MENQNNKIGQPAAPFSCTYTPSFAELLLQLNCSLAVSTYQAGKLIILSPKNSDQLIQLPRTFPRVMGIALEGDEMAVATKDEVIYMRNSEPLAWHYPKSPGVYDAMFVPRATYYTSHLDIHDLEFGNGEIFGVNTSFSTIVKIDKNYNFTPIWKPPFITELASEDRCHLNGMAMKDGKPKYATAFNKGNTAHSWKETLGEKGVLIDIDTNEIIVEGLEMPHSPRLFGDDLLVLQSRNGAISKVDTKTGQLTDIRRLNYFVRGMDKVGDYLFVGFSRIRKNSSIFGKLDIGDHSPNAGVAIIHLPTGAQVAELKYLSSVEEIYDLKIIKGFKRPNVLNTIRPDFKLGLSIPETTFWAPIEAFNQLEKEDNERMK
ncbi:MAG: TIGR03032 family protein [Bacteroidetes bacterium]|nr:TIGR03032 family protein [Bacteroidota bacterium]